MGRPPTSLEERLKAKLVRRESGCLEWTGHTIRGYGQILNSQEAIAAGRPRQIGTHKAAWEIEHGPVPDGMEVRHQTCDNPPCCDVSHLALGTTQENTADRQSKQRHYWHGREKCKRGHTFRAQDVNQSTGRRQCKRCWAANHKAWLKKQKAGT